MTQSMRILLENSANNHAATSSTAILNVFYYLYIFLVSSLTNYTQDKFQKWYKDVRRSLRSRSILRLDTILA